MLLCAIVFTCFSERFLHETFETGDKTIEGIFINDKAKNRVKDCSTLQKSMIKHALWNEGLKNVGLFATLSLIQLKSKLFALW